MDVRGDFFGPPHSTLRLPSIKLMSASVTSSAVLNCNCFMFSIKFSEEKCRKLIFFEKSSIR